MAFLCFLLPLGAEGVRHSEANVLDLESVVSELRDLTDLFKSSPEGPKKATLPDGKTYLCCCRSEEEVSCKLTDVMSEKISGFRGGCKGYLGARWSSWYNVQELHVTNSEGALCY